MRLISHRGNINGIKTEFENSLEYIITALDYGYDVEVDIWLFDEKLYFGHNTPDYIISETFIEKYKNRLWLHAKNIDVLPYLKEKSYMFFWHQTDDVTITSNGYFWTYPGKKLTKNSIAVLPEKGNYIIFDCYGICSDYIKNYN